MLSKPLLGHCGGQWFLEGHGAFLVSISLSYHLSQEQANQGALGQPQAWASGTSIGMG